MNESTNHEKGGRTCYCSRRQATNQLLAERVISYRSSSSQGSRPGDAGLWICLHSDQKLSRPATTSAPMKMTAITPTELEAGKSTDFGGAQSPQPAKRGWDHPQVPSTNAVPRDVTS
jgi:hypothetical protein